MPEPLFRRVTMTVTGYLTAHTGGWYDLSNSADGTGQKWSVPDFAVGDDSVQDAPPETLNSVDWIDWDAFYRDGQVIRPVTDDVPTARCGVCRERLKTRRDGTVVMHTRERRPFELVTTAYWCDGGLPAGAR